MTKKLILCFLFFLISPLFVFFPLYYLSFSNGGKILGEAVSFTPNTGQVFAALPEENGVVAPTIVGKDSTPIMIENYLKHYQSPLLAYNEIILKSAEKYGVRPQLIIAIAQQESNLGKKSPEGCFNAWGWGIHARGTKCYGSWEEAIESVTAGIAKDYCSKGYCDDPCLMMKKYTPKSDGSWCAGVKQFLGELESGDF